jgi:hypothetical protein
VAQPIDDLPDRPRDRLMWAPSVPGVRLGQPQPTQPDAVTSCLKAMRRHTWA